MAPKKRTHSTGGSAAKRPRDAVARAEIGEEEMAPDGLVFEDPHSDDEIPEVVVNSRDAAFGLDGEPVQEDDIGMVENDEEMEENEEEARAVYYAPRPNMEVVSTDYDMLHNIDGDTSVLCFDVIKDPFGAARFKYPLDCMLVGGCYGDSPQSKNCWLVVMKVGHLCRTKYDEDPDGFDSESDSDHENEDDEDDAEDFTLNSSKVRHNGLPQAVRSMPQNPGIIATWSALGNVSIFNMTSHVQSLAEPEAFAKSGQQVNNKGRPLFVSGEHEHNAPGYGLAWNPREEGTLASGDQRGRINIWKRTGSDGSFARTEFHEHKKSVEGIEWNPAQTETFASCSCDGTIRLWDLRDNSKKSKRTIQADIDTDINVISWNPIKKWMLASGHDNGTFKIWDLRKTSDNSSECEPLCTFDFHKKCRENAAIPPRSDDVPSEHITGIQFCPHQESLLAVSDDEQVTLWDLSAETDDADATVAYLENGDPIPPNLFFGHRGMTACRGVTWHPQIPGMLLDVTQDSVQMWKPARWQQMVEVVKKPSPPKTTA